MNNGVRITTPLRFIDKCACGYAHATGNIYCINAHDRQQERFSLFTKEEKRKKN